MFPNARYTVTLWDHDPADDGSEEGSWSGHLAQQHLGRSNVGLTFYELFRALQLLWRCGWSHVSILVERE